MCGAFDAEILGHRVIFLLEPAITEKKFTGVSEVLRAYIGSDDDDTI